MNFPPHIDAKVWVSFVLKITVDFEFRAPIFFVKMKGAGPGDSTPKGNFNPGISAKFCARFLLKSADNLEFFAPTLFEKMEAGTFETPLPQRISTPAWVAKFCVCFVLKRAVNFEFCAPPVFKKIRGLGTHWSPPTSHPPSLKANFDLGMDARFRTGFMVECVARFTFCPQPLLE